MARPWLLAMAGVLLYRPLSPVSHAYLAHPLLGDRYRQCVEAVQSWAGQKGAAEIFGDVDAMKLRSSLTLFEAASGDPVMAETLRAFFGGPDEATLRILKRS